MKLFALFSRSLLLALLSAVMVQAAPADDYCTFYYDKNYRGKYEKCDAGDHYPGRWDWAPRSLKIGKGCTAQFYYEDRFGKEKTYTFNRSETDLYRRMATWRCKTNKYWDHITKVVIYCGGGDHQANTGGHMGDWKKEYDRGYLICYARGGYEDRWEGLKMGKYPISRIQVKPYSLRIPNGYVCIFTYKDRNNRTKYHEFKESVKDLKMHFRNWNLRDWNNAYRYITYIEYKKYNGGGMADTGGHMGNWKKEYDRGYLICYARGGYEDRWEGLKMGKYPISRIQVKPYSLRIPNGYVCIFTYKDRNNRTKYHEFKESVKDLKMHFRNWNLRDWNNAYRYITYIEYKKYNGGDMADTGGHMGDWKKEYDRGYLICYARGGYEDRWEGLKMGKYPISRIQVKLDIYPFLILPIYLHTLPLHSILSNPDHIPFSSCPYDHPYRPCLHRCIFYTRYR